MVLVMATLVPGVTFTPQTAAYIRPFDTGSPSTISVNGVRSGNNEFMLDGPTTCRASRLRIRLGAGAGGRVQGADGHVRRRLRVHAGSGGQYDVEIRHQPDCMARRITSCRTRRSTPIISSVWRPENPHMRIHRERQPYRAGGYSQVYNGHNKTFFTAGFE